MRRVALVLVGVLLLAGCGGGDDDEAVPTPTPPAASSAETDLIEGLRAIDETLVDNRERAIRRADNACDAISRGTNREPVEEVRLRFDGGTTAVDTAMATEIMALLQEKYCP